MKQLIPIAILFISLTGFTPTNNTTRTIPDGYYTGHEFLMAVYLKVTSDKAIVDFISVDKFPRDLYTDTLLYNSNTNTWQGKTSRLYQKGNSWFITTSQSPYAYEPSKKATAELRVKMKPDVKGYKHIDVDKNYALTNKCFSAYMNSKTDAVAARKKYWDTRKKYPALDKMLETAPHADFVKEFEKFAATLAAQ